MLHDRRQSSTDLPLLVSIRDIAKRILTQYLASPSSPNPGSSPYAYQTSGEPSTSDLTPQDSLDNSKFRIGFITPPFRDNKIPVTGHLHAHAYITPADLMGWWRSVSYGPLAWYDIDDLIAEIRLVPAAHKTSDIYPSFTEKRAPTTAFVAPLLNLDPLTRYQVLAPGQVTPMGGKRQT